MASAGHVIERHIAATTHGRYLVRPAVDRSALFLVGFHGYGEAAELQLERLRLIPGAERCTLVSVQGLHRYYTRGSEKVVASWMTRQDRELAIADNLAYVDAVVGAEWDLVGGASGIVFAGFSQGVAMAFRAAAASGRPVAGVVAVGGDVPPELDQRALARIGRVLLCRGQRDEWYSAQQFGQDRVRLQAALVDVTPLEFDGAHEWSLAVSRAARPFLGELLT